MPEPLQRETFVTGVAAGFGAAFGAASAGCWWICLRRRRSRGQEGLQITAPVDVLRLVRDVQDPGPAGPLGDRLIERARRRTSAPTWPEHAVRCIPVCLHGSVCIVTNFDRRAEISAAGRPALAMSCASWITFVSPSIERPRTGEVRRQYTEHPTS